jgi:hypothetical protein
MEFSPEVLIFLQNFKIYLENNDDVKIYFLKNVNEDEFFKELLKTAQKNFEKTGDPKLTKNQFEFLRISLMIFKKIDYEKKNIDLIYEYTTKKIKFNLK